VTPSKPKTLVIPNVCMDIDCLTERRKHYQYGAPGLQKPVYNHHGWVLCHALQVKGHHTQNTVKSQKHLYYLGFVHPAQFKMVVHRGHTKQPPPR
jgi:hypothetical protein